MVDPVSAYVNNIPEVREWIASIPGRLKYGLESRLENGELS